MKKTNKIEISKFDTVACAVTGFAIFTIHEIQSKEVIDNTIKIWNETLDIMAVDAYLLDEEKCTQDEREIIIGSIVKYFDL